MTSQSRWLDSAMVERMASNTGRRYPPEFWRFFESAVQPRIGQTPAVADLGCGGGVLLQELGARLPGAALQGLDLSDAMLAHAMEQDYPVGAPAFAQHDLNRAPYPIDDASLDLCISANVVCFLDNPLTLFAEARRMLRPGGLYLLYDWRRQPLAEYIDNRGGFGDDPTALMSLQPHHNRFTADDWRWLLDAGGLDVIGEAHPRVSHIALACVPR